MSAQIIVNQAAHSAGVAGKAREDLALGTPISLSLAGGPFLQHLWSIIDRPINIVTPVESTSVISTPTAATTLLQPVDVAGTYLVECLVDSGNGLGASPADVARITFYAGPTLAADPRMFPRRVPAFRETVEHNVNDALNPSGNDEGWAREMRRWFAAVENVQHDNFSSGRVQLTGGGASIIGTAFNVASVLRLSLGTVRVTFTTAAPGTTYSVHATARSAGGSCTIQNELVGSFEVVRGDFAGALVDSDFNFSVKLND